MKLLLCPAQIWFYALDNWVSNNIVTIIQNIQNLQTSFNSVLQHLFGISLTVAFELWMCHLWCVSAWRTAISGGSHQDSLKDPARRDAGAGWLSCHTSEALGSKKSHSPRQQQSTRLWPRTRGVVVPDPLCTFLCKSGEHFILDTFMYITLGIDSQTDSFCTRKYEIRAAQ